MMTINPVVIPFSKSKIFLLLIGANVFVGIGGWLLFGNPTFDNTLLDNPWFTKTTGLASLVFFGIAVYFLIGKLIAKSPGLVIDDVGIEDYSSAVTVPKIYWKDVEAIEVLTIKSQPLILFKVSNPQIYIDGAKGFKRKMMALNYKWYGTPLCISANGLRVSFEELLQLVSERFEVYANIND
ncbi:STM3941 family protein [Pedobacter heparinus]|uniref:STM3941 family protein n=1 Tax=Pedobacter heparinus TaxID=984 RepID=UPI002931ACB4|nr:STM3941 family protein [Pedobacter heparinus]